MREYLREWDEKENYRVQEASLNLLFHQLCPGNSELEHVLLKVSALNDFYSTNIFDTYTVARHILQQKFDERLCEPDYSLVGDIASISFREKSKRFYSFATKYCSHHDSSRFPIFDRFVERLLWHYKCADDFHQFERIELRDYPRYVEIVDSFRQHYKLSEFSYRQVDLFLWQAGKDWFPRKYV